MGWEQDSGVARQGMAGRVVIAICGIATALVGYAADKAKEEGTEMDIVAITRDAGALLEQEDFSMAPWQTNVEFAVDDASGTYNELSVAPAGSDGGTDLYQISAPDTDEVACLAVSAGEPPPGEFLGSVEVSTSVTSGPC